MWRLGCELARLVRGAWRNDRLRVPPGEGRLLRIEPPDIVRIGPHLVEVISRTVGESPRGPYVALGCRCGDRTGGLCVELAGHRPVATFGWSHEGQREPIDEHDIAVFGRSRRSARAGL